MLGTMFYSKLSCVFVLPTLDTGGAERVMVTLINNIPVESKSLLAVCSGGAFEKGIDDGVDTVNLNCRRVRSAFVPLIRYIDRKRPDVVVSTITHMNFLMLLIKPFFPKETRLIVREATLPSYFLAKNRVKKAVAMLGYKYLYPRADLVISPAQRIVDEFRDVFHLDVSNHVVLPNPVDVELLRSRAKETPHYIHGDDIKAVRYISVARLNWAKGLDRLIENLPLLPPDLNWELLILGEGEERARLEGLIEKHNLQGKVKLPGLAENPWSDLSRADVCLLPSRWEGLPNVVLESLAVGTPVIATREAGGIQEIADRSGGGITIVDTMDAFIEAMGRVTPSAHRHMCPDLLPDDYHLENVIKKFMSFIR